MPRMIHHKGVMGDLLRAQKMSAKKAIQKILLRTKPSGDGLWLPVRRLPLELYLMKAAIHLPHRAGFGEVSLWSDPRTPQPLSRSDSP